MTNVIPMPRWRVAKALSAGFVLLAAAAVVGIIAPWASATEPTYQRTQEMSCSSDAGFWWYGTTMTVRADATIEGQADGSERIVSVGNFRFEDSSWPEWLFWLIDTWHSTPEQIAHSINESGGKHATWFAGGTLRAVDNAVPLSCVGDLSIS
jgi:hypothetical protein